MDAEDITSEGTARSGSALSTGPGKKIRRIQGNYWRPRGWKTPCQAEHSAQVGRSIRRATGRTFKLGSLGMGNPFKDVMQLEAARRMALSGLSRRERIEE